MKKLVFDTVIIEKSEKDDVAGKKIELSGGFNVIYGKNEAGKSSLMNFIKYGLFKEKGCDTGKIYFSVIDNDLKKSYKADIKDSPKPDLRVKLSDENDVNCEYSIITDLIDRKYFEQGFTITLDDLMNIQNKDTSTLTDAIKDPTGRQLNDFTDEIKLKTKKIYGDNNKLTKEINNILKKISDIDFEINKGKGNETAYINALNDIKDADLALKKAGNTEKLAEIKSLSEKEKDELKKLIEQKNIIKCRYSSVFAEKSDEYTEIIKNAGIFEYNCNDINKNEDGLEVLNSKITAGCNKLRTEYYTDTDTEKIKNFNFDNTETAKVKELLKIKEKAETEINSINSKIEFTHDAILKLNSTQEAYKKEILSNEKYEALKKLYSEINTALSQYSEVLSKINEINEKIGNKPDNQTVGFILSGLILITGAIISGISIYFKNFFALIPSGLTFIFGCCITAFLYCSKPDKALISEKKYYTELKNEIIENLKSKINKDYEKIDISDVTLLSVKFNDIKNEIKKIIDKQENIQNLIKENIQETTSLQNKSAENRKIKAENEFIIKETENTIKEIIKNNGFNESITPEQYIDASILLSEIKNLISEKETIETESENKKRQNENIKTHLNDFIADCNINIYQSENYSENISKIKDFNETNRKIKEQIDELSVKIEILQKRTDEYEQKINSQIKGTYYESGDVDFNLLAEEKNKNTEKRKNAEYVKKRLEDYEGINSLKTERECLLTEYKRKIFELVKYKTIISVTEKAKNEFNKIQPCLNEAEKYLSVLTCGKYTKINLNSEEITNSGGTISKKWQNLSRGTKEQLYFALRLGYAANYSRDTLTGEAKTKPALPLTIDDAFVNFDDERTYNAIKCLSEFSKTNPVLYFTCRGNEIIQKIKEIDSEVNLISI